MGQIVAWHWIILLAAVGLAWLCMKGLGHVIGRWRGAAMIAIAAVAYSLQNPRLPDLLSSALDSVAIVFFIGGIIGFSINPQPKNSRPPQST